MNSPVDTDQIALAVQQPWAELIVRGIKTIEVRSTSARTRGPIYIYASRRPSNLPDADGAADRFNLDIDSLPRGVIVGRANLVESRPATVDDTAAACVTPERLRERFAWRFSHPEKFADPIAVKFLPYGIWFYPFRRRSNDDF